ncbi:asialoglycoprotein receptor 1-like [Portunus trituberculatus]|uniref:asialoglycoprotein receptor 1-like n=1 Tax=Portunus trituberculatus TaxID=210409 RepID=UPI001E1CC4F4|nr:asialoglycoprotein receptor 1-like [Portunus trituberculatus]
MTAMHLKALTVVLMVVALPTIQSCSAPFKLLANRWCVAAMIGGTNASLHSWEPARRDCQSHGGDLIILEDHDKMRAVSDYLDTFDARRSGYPCWVGGRTVSGVWQWVDGSEMNLQSHLWAPEEPTNISNQETSMPYWSILKTSAAW